MKNWELQMKAYYEKARRAGSYNIEHMFLAFDKIAQEAFKNGEMKEGDSYIVPITDGTHYKFRFKKEMPEIIAIDALDYRKRVPLLTYEKNDTAQQYRQKLTDALKAIGITFNVSHHCFGERFPEKLRSSLYDLKPGTVISFNNGPKYVCTKRESVYLTLQHVYSGSLKDFSYDDYKKNNNKITVDVSSARNMQSFFENNAKELTQRMEMSVSFLSDAETVINNIEQQTLNSGNPTKFFLGITDIIAKPSKNGQECIWFDTDMNRISKEDVITLRALMDCSPYERNYIHKELQTDATLVNDTLFEQQLENLAVQKDYSSIYSSSIGYVSKNQKDLMIEMLHFNKQGDDFIPTGVYFAAENGITKAFKVTYKDNDFNKDEEKIEELSKEEFEKICEQIYHDKFQLIHTRTEELALAAVIENAKQQNKNIDKENLVNNEQFFHLVDQKTETVMKKDPQIIKAKRTANVNFEDVSKLIHDYMNKSPDKATSAKNIIDDLDNR